MVNCNKQYRKMQIFKAIHKFPVYCIILMSTLKVVRSGKDVLELSVPEDCKDNEYFDLTTLSCIECEADLHLVPSANRLQCQCNKYSKMTDFKNGRPVCAPCDHGKVASFDGVDCIPCGKTSCDCKKDEIRMDRFTNGTLLDSINCLSCRENTFPSTDKSKCLPCDNYLFMTPDNCNCPSTTHVKIHKYCLPKQELNSWMDVRSTYLIQFERQNIDSFYLRTELEASMYACKKKHKIACEHLSHMCALTMYRNGTPCLMFLQTHASPVWLFYNKDQTTSVLNGKRISQAYSLMKDDPNSILNFTIATYSLEGHLLSIDKPHMPCNMMKRIRFGVNFNKQCKITVQELLNQKMTFLSPYLAFVEDEKILIHALPVAVKNNNKGIKEMLQWQFVRKFFLVDNISGFKALPEFESTNLKRDSEITNMRYIKYLGIVVNVQNGENKGNIFPPILIVEYGELTKEEITKDMEVIINYDVTFLSKESGVEYNLEVIISTLSGLALIFSGLKTWSHYKKDYVSIPNLSLLLWFFIYSMGAVGNVIVFTLIAFCIYLFIFYKGQTVPYLLLPNDTNESTVQICTTIAVLFKVMEVIGFIYQYWNVNVFFIDWEQSKTVNVEYKYDSPHTSLTKTYSSKFLENEYKRSLTPSEIIAARRKKTPRKSKKDNDFPKHNTDGADIELSTVSCSSRASISEAYECNSLPISIWRTYFIASQWLKLQSQRKVSITFQLIMTSLIFQIFKMNSWTLAIPELNATELSEVKKSFTLTYAVCALVYIAVYSVQWLGFVAFYERYIQSRIQEFVDLCSITNISVFIFPYNYYGFYIHGRSVHGFADVDLAHLIENLKQEESNLCAHRGLVPGTSEQTFIVSLTETFNTVYKEFSKQKHGRNRFLRSNDFFAENCSHICNTRSQLKQFFCQFVDHCYENEDYIVKEMHFLERLCNIFFTNAKEKSIFYIDKNYSFDQVLLYGNEWLLASLELSVFTFVITVWEDCILAPVITAVVSKLIILITKYNSKRNLSSKSYLDERFVI